jgi:hypothetical protein
MAAFRVAVIFAQVEGPCLPRVFACTSRFFRSVNVLLLPIYADGRPSGFIILDEHHWLDGFDAEWVRGLGWVIVG